METNRPLDEGMSGASGGALRSRLQESLLYMVTPSRPPAGDINELLPRVLEAGVDMIQLRDKEMEAGELIGYCEVVRRRTSEFGALFIVNDRVDVALAAGADGVHLGQGDLPVAQARRQMGPVPLIGLSTHSEDQLLASLALEIDYAAVGPIFPTPTKPGRPGVGLDLIGFSVKFGARPIFAIGGIDRTNLVAVCEAGAKRVSVVRALTHSDEPYEAARFFSTVLRGRFPAKHL